MRVPCIVRTTIIQFMLDSYRICKIFDVGFISFSLIIIFLFSTEVNLNLNFLAKYIGTEGKLEEIQVRWNEMVRHFQLVLAFHFYIIITLFCSKCF